MAYAQRLAEHYGLYCWVCDDVKDAFPSIPISRLRDVLRKRLPDARLLDLIDRTLPPNHKKGLLQGCSISMLLANTFFDHFVDRRWRQQAPRWPLIRYADDLLLLAGTPAEAEDAYRLMQRLVREAGMRLKGNEGSAIHDLANGQRMDWLGYRIDLAQDGIRARLPIDEQPDGFWDSLQAALLTLHDGPDAPLLAPQLIESTFVGHGAPCFPHHRVDAIYHRTRSIARECGFGEMPSCHHFGSRWCTKYDEWNCRKNGLAIPDGATPRDGQRGALLVDVQADSAAKDDAAPPF